MAKYHNECHAVLKEAEVFPIEVDLSRSTFTYDLSNQFNDGAADDDEDAAEAEAEAASEAKEDPCKDVDLISTE